MMTKILFFLLLAVLIYFAVRARRKAGQPAKDAVKPLPAAEDIVACSRCGVHIPISDSVAAGDRRYCSAEHARLG